MTNVYTPRATPRQIIYDALASLSHVPVEGWLVGLIILAGVYYVLRRDKAALVIAITGAFYLIPFLMNGLRI